MPESEQFSAASWDWDLLELYGAMLSDSLGTTTITMICLVVETGNLSSPHPLPCNFIAITLPSPLLPRFPLKLTLNVQG